MHGLRESLESQRGGEYLLAPPPTGILTPGYWVCAAALANKGGHGLHDLQLHGDHLEYAKAIRMQEALGQPDSYRHQRLNNGKNYNPLVVLASREDVDRATSDIGSCIDTCSSGLPAQSNFVANLKSVVGDLHDNVWSHGNSTGISMAQYWNRTGNIEFALADCGYGLLGELRRSGFSKKLGITNDAEAINWCIEEGNSTKKRKSDGWEQTVPEDISGNPMSGVETVLRGDGNHHMGMGLAKLVQLIRNYSGQLWLASGNSLLTIKGLSKATFHNIPEWKGVAISCRFNFKSIANILLQLDDIDRELEKLVRGVS